MLITGCSAFSALCRTTEISDQRSERSSSSSASSTSTARARLWDDPGLGWKSTWPAVITPGERSRRIAAMAVVVLPLPLSPASPRTWPRRSVRSQSTTAWTAPSSAIAHGRTS